MTQYRIKLKDLNESYLQKLRNEHSDGDIEVTILVSDLSKDPEKRTDSESLFWQVIDRLDWEATEDSAILAPAIELLSQQAPDRIKAFADILSEKLYHLDQRRMAEQSIEEEEEFSTDLFLYARCAVVANGKVAYETVMADPAKFPKDTFFSALLNLPDLAWKRSTGETFDYLPQYIYETGFNPQGWPDDVITL